ncbi:Elongation of very long chain fatty acids protein 4, partial [Harpegnathos saltator]
LLLPKLANLVEATVNALWKEHIRFSSRACLRHDHHMSGEVFVRIYRKYVAGGMSTFITPLNCSVHVIMYTYYLLATFGPAVQKVINPIKLFITILQV